MFVVIVIFCWQDLARMYEHFKRRDRGSHHDAVSYFFSLPVAQI
jgi:hypothetical protein